MGNALTYELNVFPVSSLTISKFPEEAEWLFNGGESLVRLHSVRLSVDDSVKGGWKEYKWHFPFLFLFDAMLSGMWLDGIRRKIIPSAKKLKSAVDLISALLERS